MLKLVCIYALSCSLAKAILHHLLLDSLISITVTFFCKQIYFVQFNILLVVRLRNVVIFHSILLLLALMSRKSMPTFILVASLRLSHFLIILLQ